MLSTPTPVELEVATDFIQTLIDKAHEFQAKEELVEPDPGSNASDDDMREVLEDRADDPVQQELHEMLADLNQDQLADLVTLVWLGRGDFTASEWREKRKEALRLDPKRTPDYLIETPLLADYLEEGLSAIGH
jgi:predicted house-cleaning noncanonical NTP pyrophosphatase (MazG superfamily)